jgi:hypothetical protein
MRELNRRFTRMPFKSAILDGKKILGRKMGQEIDVAEL